MKTSDNMHDAKHIKKYQLRKFVSNMKTAIRKVNHQQRDELPDETNATRNGGSSRNNRDNRRNQSQRDDYRPTRNKNEQRSRRDARSSSLIDENQQRFAEQLMKLVSAQFTNSMQQMNTSLMNNMKALMNTNTRREEFDSEEL